MHKCTSTDMFLKMASLIRPEYVAGMSGYLCVDLRFLSAISTRNRWRNWVTLFCWDRSLLSFPKCVLQQKNPVPKLQHNTCRWINSNEGKNKNTENILFPVQSIRLHPSTNSHRLIPCSIDSGQREEMRKDRTCLGLPLIFSSGLSITHTGMEHCIILGLVC